MRFPSEITVSRISFFRILVRIQIGFVRFSHRHADDVCIYLVVYYFNVLYFFCKIRFRQKTNGIVASRPERHAIYYGHGRAAAPASHTAKRRNLTAAAAAAPETNKRTIIADGRRLLAGRAPRISAGGRRYRVSSVCPRGFYGARPTTVPPPPPPRSCDLIIITAAAEPLLPGRCLEIYSYRNFIRY